MTSRLAVLVLTSTAVMSGANVLAQETRELPAVHDGYAIVVSRETLATDGWKQVVSALRTFHRDRGVRTFLYEDSPLEISDALAEGGDLPRWMVLVARPSELDRTLHLDLKRLVRGLDEDPWPDVQWGVVTGSDWSSAMRQVVTREPLVIRRAAAGTSLDVERFDEAVWWDESTAGRSVRKHADGRVVDTTADARATMPGIVSSLNDFKPDLFLSSGRATQDDWRVGYEFKAGAFKARGGELIGVDLDRNRLPVESPNPKVWLAAGNCLLGHVKDDDSMALSILGAAGATQFLGYSTVTWHGRAGWGTTDWFLSDPGRHSIADAFHLNQVELISELIAISPELAHADLGTFEPRDDEGFRAAMAEHGPRGLDEATFEEALGHLWDRDAMVFYGDPAWDARLAPEQGLPWSVGVSSEGDTWRIRFEAEEAVELTRPMAVILPHRLLVHEVLSGGEGALISDTFVMLPGIRALEAGAVHEVVLRADPVELTTVTTIKRTAEETEAQLARLDASSRASVREQLRLAGDNRGQLVAAIEGCQTEAELRAVAFLLEHMPRRDLVSLEGTFLLAHLRGALQAREDSRFCRDLPEEVFHNEVLPYAFVGERRELWREPLRERYLELVQSAPDQEAAVALLNKRVWSDYGIKYHATKRPKTDQCPSETIDCGIASCTGLSIILGDACRAVGIPTRLAGVPMWHNDTGNHTWIEVWDDGAWHFVEALGSDGYDRAWWTEHARKAKADDPLYAVWATTYRPTGTHFPLEWDPDDVTIPAVNVTERYVD
ncbi:MAG: hypothetical protein MK082_08820 [Phycisphaerales bacterium]|nr:hypothetical protein [Phycisphaerales bacterium]